MISRNNLPQSRPNCTEKTVFVGRSCLQATDSIPTIEQLSLFDSAPQSPKHLSNPDLEVAPIAESDKPYPLQIGYIPDRSRTAPDRFCKLIHYESSLNIPGQYTHALAERILRITRDWDWELNGLGIPRCRDRLLLLLSSFSCERDFQVGGEADA